jgi:hypothetical protein
VLSTLNTELLRKIAEHTGGAFFHVGPGAPGVEGLGEALATLSKGEMEADVLVDFVDRYEYLLFPAFLAFIAEAVIGDRGRRRRVAATSPVEEKGRAKAA